MKITASSPFRIASTNAHPNGPGLAGQPHLAHEPPQPGDSLEPSTNTARTRELPTGSRVPADALRSLSDFHLAHVIRRTSSSIERKWLSSLPNVGDYTLAALAENEAKATGRLELRIHKNAADMTLKHLAQRAAGPLERVALRNHAKLTPEILALLDAKESSIAAKLPKQAPPAAKAGSGGPPHMLANREASWLNAMNSVFSHCLTKAQHERNQ